MGISKEQQTGSSSRVVSSGVFAVDSEACISCESKSPICRCEFPLRLEVNSIEVHAVQERKEKTLFYMVQAGRYTHFSEIMTFLKHF